MKKLIHWKGTPVGVCDRKDSGADSSSVTQGDTTITWQGEAYHLENVTCPICREEISRS